MRNKEMKARDRAPKLELEKLLEGKWGCYGSKGILSDTVDTASTISVRCAIMGYTSCIPKKLLEFVHSSWQMSR